MTVSQPATVSAAARLLADQMAAAVDLDLAVDLSGLSNVWRRVTSDGLVQVYVHVQEVSEATVQALASAGLHVELRSVRLALIQGWAHYSQFDSLADIAGVVGLSLPSYALPNTGSVNSEGDAALNVDDFRTQLGLDGTGTMVGVISNGIDHWAEVMPLGDLPTAIHLHPTQPGSGDEGTAMLEIVHDLAPGADLAFAGASTNAEMVSAIEWLTAEGCDVIVDDLTFYMSNGAGAAEPYFEDGAIADAAGDAVAAGVVYVTSAGNWQQSFDGQWHASMIRGHWQGAFDNGGNGFQDFNADPGIVDQGLAVYVAAGGWIWVNLQWSDGWGVSANNYDLHLMNGALNWPPLWGSTLPQTGTQNPWEGFFWQNNGPDQWVNVVIERVAGAARELELFVASVRASGLEYTSGDSLAHQQAVESVVSVGAVPSDDAGHDDVAGYSSHGPSTVYTDFVNQVSDQRETLDLCGIAGVHTAVGGLGHFSDPFHGTSAAASHIAAIAALLMEGVPTLTPALVHDLITGNAVDIQQLGYDHVSGHGLADALAIASAAPTAVDLLPSWDTGISDEDDVTNRDNSAAQQALQFSVSGTIAGATVTLYADGQEIGSATGQGGVTTVPTNGTHDLLDGGHTIAARQEQPGRIRSAASPALTITVDTEAPTATGVTPSGNESFDDVTQMVVQFSEDVMGLAQGALTLTRTSADPEEVVDLTGTTFVYDSQAHTGSWGLPQPGPNFGRYEVELESDGLADAAGNAMGEDYGYGVIDAQTFENIIIAIVGDTDFDGWVAATDYLAIKRNYGTATGATWEQADMDFDRAVGFRDYVILKGHFGARYDADNAFPEADADGYQVSEDDVLTVLAAAGVLDNDSDADGHDLEAELLEFEGFTGVEYPAHGEVTVNADGSLVYTPDEDFEGVDYFYYRITDHESGVYQGGAAFAMVTVTVEGVNDPPEAADDVAETDDDTPVVTPDVLANDIDVDEDELSVSDYTQGGHGQVAYNGDGTFTYTPDAGWHGIDSFTYTVTDGVPGSDDEATVTVTVNDTTPPTVIDVIISSSFWDQSFLDELGGLGYSVPAGEDQLDPLPWVNITQISLVFSEDVTVVQPELSVYGVNVSEYSFSGFVYDGATQTATWTFVDALEVDKLLVVLQDSVTDEAGNALDGEWIDGAGDFPSGDGVAGGDFEFRLDVLPGDVDQDGDVDEDDVDLVRGAANTTPGDAGYVIYYDVDGSGEIRTSDTIKTTRLIGTLLPLGDPSPPE